MSKISPLISPLLASVFLTACQPPGQDLGANVYQANQVNTVQQAKVVTILAVMPAKVAADNTQEKKGAEVAGALLGAIGGGVLGNSFAGHNAAGTTVGVIGGGLAGSAVGSLVPDKVLIDGVSVTYDDHGQTLNSAQVGQLCEYVPGKAIVVSTSPTETRIQPNAVCPAKVVQQ
jgi:outer membrane lipoprotein SlyB